MFAFDSLSTSNATTANVRSPTFAVIRHLRSRPSGETVSASASNKVELPHTILGSVGSGQSGRPTS
jgi:hypothetical protein